MIRRIAAALLGLTGLLLLPAPAQAHPLGNFTTNQYAGVRVGATGIDVDVVLDLAELPAYQTTRDEIDSDRDGTPSPAERDTYAARTCTAAAAAATLTIGGRPVALSGTARGLTFPPGAGGLDTLRLECMLHADARLDTTTTIEYRTGLFPDRIGWREITAVGDRYTLTRTDVPADSISARLTAYPAGVTGSDVRAATLTVRPGGPAAPAAATDSGGTQARGADRLTAWFTDLIGRPHLTVGIGILAFVIALVLGGAHAVAPGHGKTIMAAYLVGTRGRLTQALTVAVTVAATHTVGVLVLGILLATSLQLAPDSIYAWLRLVSGVLVALVGAHLLRRAWRRREPVGGSHDHDHDHDHDHVHSDGHAHGRTGVGAHRHRDDHDHGDDGSRQHGSEPDHQPGLVPVQSHRPAPGAGGVPPRPSDDPAFVPAAPHEHAHDAAHGHGLPHARSRGHDVPPDSAHHAATHAAHHAATHAGDHAATHAGDQTATHAAHHAATHAEDHAAAHAGDRAVTSRDRAEMPAPARGAAPLTHSHGGHAHTHHLPEPDEPLRLRTLLAMGFAGGLSPSPSAVVVLLGAAALGRAWYGVLIVLAYGIGLAATLIGIGFALARWGERLHRAGSGRWSRLLTHRMPALTAAAIFAVGAGMVAFATAELVG